MSLKKSIALHLSSLLENENLEGHKLILSTSSGTICGRFPTEEELADEDTVYAALAEMCQNIGNNYKNELGLQADDSLPGDEGYLFLVDVQILTGMKAIDLPFIIVFYDEIVGISFGHL